MRVDVAFITVAGISLNLTMFSEALLLKLTPLIITTESLAAL
jgi:hypothetical protein